MKFDIGAIFGQLVSLYTRLPLAQKIALPILVMATMGTIVFVSRWAGQADYALLYSGLEESDAAAVVEALKDKKVGFKLRDGGRTIDVTPPEKVNELKLDLAAASLPKGKVNGFELFNENSLGRTGFVEQITLTRALQGELERTIASLEAVKSVRVHISRPERSAFVKRDVLPTASVMLQMRAGAELSPQQIKGIANLVSHGVERLTPENVTILDSRGNLLNEKKDAEAINGADTTRLEYQRSVESSYVKRIESMLNEILGPGKGIARVTADMDFSKFEKEEESFDPGSQVARSERSVTENDKAAAEGGVPGVLSNLTNEPGLINPPNSIAGGTRRSELVKNYEVSRAVSKTVAAAGKINKLSVAVLVDGLYAPTEGGQKAYQPLAPEMIKKIENLVKQAVGFDATRGDVVTVENIHFFEPDASVEQALEAAERQNLITNAASYVLPAMFILLFMLWVVRPMVKFLVNPTEAEVDLSRLLPAGIEELEAELEQERSKVSTIPEISTPSIDMEELESLLAENSRMVKESPQQAALLIRYWLNEGRM